MTHEQAILRALLTEGSVFRFQNLTLIKYKGRLRFYRNKHGTHHNRDGYFIKGQGRVSPRMEKIIDMVLL